MKLFEDFEGPDLRHQAKILTASFIVVGSLGYFLDYSNRSSTDILISTISGVLFGQIVTNILGLTGKFGESIRFHSLIASFTPFPSFVSGITLIGLRHLFF